MTQLRHVAWYVMIIASTYGANDKREEFIVLAIVAAALYAVSYFERKQ